jgi:hypothetical protein
VHRAGRSDPHLDHDDLVGCRAAQALEEIVDEFVILVFVGVNA